MRRIALLIALIIILVACGSKTNSQPIATIQDLSSRTIATEAATEEPFKDPTPTETPLPPPPTASPEALSTPQPVATPTEIKVTEVVETPTSPPTVINGQYENTYFRGSATAPITLIDYSDFL